VRRRSRHGEYCGLRMRAEGGLSFQLDTQPTMIAKGHLQSFRDRNRRNTSPWALEVYGHLVSSWKLNQPAADCEPTFGAPSNMLFSYGSL
jgi:hypothetical protein